MNKVKESLSKVLDESVKTGIKDMKMLPLKVNKWLFISTSLVVPLVVCILASYMMDINTTGNLFVAYPDETMPADIWENAKLQNRDSIQEIWYGFDLNTTNSVDLGLVKEIAEISAEWKAKIDACATVEELEKIIEEAYKATSELEAVIKSLDKNTEDPNALIYIYNEWFKNAHG